MTPRRRQEMHDTLAGALAMAVVVVGIVGMCKGWVTMPKGPMAKAHCRSLTRGIVCKAVR